MIHTGIANLPLHGGKAPKWLFKRMVKLSKSIAEIIICEYGKKEFLIRLSDPFWFQALSCVLAWDWHSSGATTVTCAALKEALDPEAYGFAITGGKGKASRKTLQEIEDIGDKYNITTHSIDKLKYSSKMSAKIDNTAVQDGHNLYHHVFLFTEDKKWAVIQQGMCTKTNYARRYHWFYEKVDDFVCEPHSAIIADIKKDRILNMTSKFSKSSQKISVDLVNDGLNNLKRDWANIIRSNNQKTLDNWIYPNHKDKSIICLDMPKSINWVKLREIYDFQPRNYEEFLGIKGVGPNTVRALALISELIYGEKPSWNDPVYKFTFAHGGKDGVPHEVDLPTYSNSISFLKNAIENAKIKDKDRLNLLKRLRNIPEMRDIIEIPNN